DEANHRGDAQHAAGEIHAGDAADQREREIDHDEHRIARSAERQHQQHEQTDDHASAPDQQPLGGVASAFELPAIFDAIALRHRHLLRHGSLHVVNDAAEIATGDVARDHDPALDLLAQD